MSEDSFENPTLKISRHAQGGLNLGLGEAVGEPFAEVSVRPRLRTACAADDTGFGD